MRRDETSSPVAKQELQTRHILTGYNDVRVAVMIEIRDRHGVHLRRTRNEGIRRPEAPEAVAGKGLDFKSPDDDQIQLAVTIEISCRESHSRPGIHVIGCESSQSVAKHDERSET